MRPLSFPILKKKALFPIILLIGITCFQASAQDEKKALSLGDCLQIALQNNLGLKSRNTALESSSLESIAASALFDPAFTFNLYNSVNKTGGISLQDETTTGSETKSFAGNFEINKQLFSGDKWSLKFESGRSSSQLALTSGSQTAYQGQTTLSYTHPLLEGADSFINRSGITIAELKAKQDRMNRDDLTRQLKQQVTSTFFDTLKSEKAIEVAEIALKDAQTLLDSVKARQQAGYIAAYDVMASESGLASREENLLLAKTSYLNNVDSMKNLMGLSLIEDVKFAGDLEPGTHEIPAFDKAMDAAKENRPDLKALDFSLNAAEIQVEINKNRVMNTLALVGQVGLQGEDTSWSGALGGMNNPNWYLGLNYTMPLGGNREAVTRLRQAEFELESLKLSREDRIQNIKLEITQALRNIETAKERVSVTQNGVNLQEEKLKMEKARFELGLITSGDLLEFEADLASARLRHIEARADYLKAMSYLDFVTGLNWKK